MVIVVGFIVDRVGDAVGGGVCDGECVVVVDADADNAVAV